MRKSIFTAESQFSKSSSGRIRPNRNFHEIGCSRPKSSHKRSPSSDHEKINFYGRIAIFMKLGAHWVLTAQIGARASPSSDHKKDFYGRIAIFTAGPNRCKSRPGVARSFMKLGAHRPNRVTSAPRAQIMRKSIFTAESQFS